MNDRHSPKFTDVDEPANGTSLLLRRPTGSSLNVGIVGGGPGGLLAAIKLVSLGHQVTVLEKSAPYGGQGHEDSRSFNLTADPLGLRAYNDCSWIIHRCGQEIHGRAVYGSSGRIFKHDYGHRPTDRLISISRGDLLSGLTEELHRIGGGQVLFNCQVQNADPTTGTVTWVQTNDCQSNTQMFDLLILSDGVKGVGADIARHRPGISISIQALSITYLKVNILPEATRRLGLAFDRICFFPKGTSLAIGLPNRDGSISVLIEDRFSGPRDRPMFTSIHEANEYAIGLNETLRRAVPDLSGQLVGQHLGVFYTSRTSSWRVGKRAILLGDAGACAPPWAGFGMNLACSHALGLEQALLRHDNLDDALDEYERCRMSETNVIQKVVAGHGKLLMGGMDTRLWQLGQRMREACEVLFGRRSMYQQIAFDEGGLERLAGTRNDEKEVKSL